MDDIDFDELLLYIYRNHMNQRLLIPYRIIDKGLRDQKSRKGSDPVEIKKLFVDLGFATWFQYGRNKCLKWSTKGINYVTTLASATKEND
jgi:hypothetical protein